MSGILLRRRTLLSVPGGPKLVLVTGTLSPTWSGNAQFTFSVPGITRILAARVWNASFGSGTTTNEPIHYTVADTDGDGIVALGGVYYFASGSYTYNAQIVNIVGNQLMGKCFHQYGGSGFDENALGYQIIGVEDETGLMSAKGTKPAASNTITGLGFTPFVVGVRSNYGTVEARDKDNNVVFSWYQSSSFSQNNGGNISMYDGGFTLNIPGSTTSSDFPYVAYGY